MCNFYYLNYGKYSSIGRTMACGPIGWRFEPFYLPLLLSYLNWANFTTSRFNDIYQSIENNFSTYTRPLLDFIKINDLIWQEGLFCDFLQKKITDNWIKKFLIFSSSLFNDRLVFDKIIKFYLLLLIWPLHKYSIMDVNNISSLVIFLLSIFFLYILFFFYYLF